MPLIALHRGRDDGLRPLAGPERVVRAMKQYCGSVCFDSSGRVIAVSAPRGHLVTFWDAGTGGYISSARIVDGSGVAPSGPPAEFLASGGRGGMIAVDARSGAASPRATPFLAAGRWDNHLMSAR